MTTWLDLVTNIILTRSGRVHVWLCVGQFKKDPDPTGRKRQALAKLLYKTKFNIKVFRMLLKKVK